MPIGKKYTSQWPSGQYTHTLAWSRKQEKQQRQKVQKHTVKWFLLQNGVAHPLHKHPLVNRVKSRSTKKCPVTNKPHIKVKLFVSAIKSH